jgi:dipeptidase D
MDSSVTHILALFEEINAIPRCSKNESQLAAWIRQWAQKNSFKVRQDKTGNLVIEVPATADHCNAPEIVIQGHMDMVCEKTPTSQHDFATDPIKPLLNGDWLQADQTTLGADNGIAIAMALAIAKNHHLPHPPLELLFTVDEETGLNGASQLEPGFIKGNTLLNIDSEDEGIFTVGCAGGVDSVICLPLTASSPASGSIYLIKASGMRGGHSGVDIHKQRANANQLIARCLAQLQQISSAKIISITGGSAHNAIPREAEAIIACDSIHYPALQAIIRGFKKTMRQEIGKIEAELDFGITPVEKAQTADMAFTTEQSNRILQFLLALPHGVVRMSLDRPNLVETSCNLATIRTQDDHIEVVTSQRSSVMSRLDEMTAKIAAIGSLAGASTVNKNTYPAWEPDFGSELLHRCQSVYQETFGCAPKVEVIHAGLECGVIGSKYDEMDMISFGPTIKNPHSPDEKLYIPSLGKVWTFLTQLLGSYV